MARADATPAIARPTVSGGVFAAVLELARWPNALIAAACVVLGASWAGAITPATWALAVAAVGLTVVANAVNDLCDRELDRVAHPARPLPRGAITTAAARRVATLGGLLALVASSAVSATVGAASAAVIAATVLYSVRVKRAGLAGNALVALLASLPFVYGAWSTGRPGRAIPLFALAVPLHFAREVAKDLDDREGDRPLRRTLPLTAGVGAARATVVAAVGLFVLAAGLFFARRAPLAVSVLAASLLAAAGGAHRSVAGRAGAPALLKGAMLLAIAAAAADVVLRRA